MCFIPMSVHNELFNCVHQLRWQPLSPVVTTFSTSIRLLSSFLINHLFLSLSVSMSLCFSVSLFLFLWYSISFS